MKVSKRAARFAVSFLGSPSVTDAALRMDSCGPRATWSTRQLADLPSAPAPGAAQKGRHDDIGRIDNACTQMSTQSASSEQHPCCCGCPAMSCCCHPTQVQPGAWRLRNGFWHKLCPAKLREHTSSPTDIWCIVMPCIALDQCCQVAVGSRLGRENMRCRDRLGRPVVLPDFLRGSRIPTERLLNAPRLVTSSWSDCSLLLLPLTPAHRHPISPSIELLLEQLPIDSGIL